MPSFMRSLVSATGLLLKGVCQGLVLLEEWRAAGMLLQQLGELFQLLVLVLQAGSLGGELGQLAGDQAFGFLPGKLRHIGQASQQGSELTQFATQLLGLANKPDPLQVFRTVDAILAAPPGFWQQPELLVETDRLGCGARQTGKFADIHIAARKGCSSRGSL
ncbi:hypothetical protein AERO9A_180034 [Aeromonas salmonicida]|nr:hypothetical protein AERO9A_180034 [Aeromonas salmonicida]